MTREEAIARIKNHKILHKMNEPRAIYISEALDMAIKALEQELKEYEQSQNEIKVGDEVYLSDEHYPRVVTCVTKTNGENPVAIQLTKSGKWVTDNITELHKTGRHFDQIEEVLKALKEE